MKIQRSLILVLACIAVLCGRASEEERVVRFLDRLMVLAEGKDLPGLMAHFAPDYSDFEGRDKEAAKALIGAYFARSRGIVIHHLGTNVESLDAENGRVSVRTEVMLSSGAGEIFRRIARLAGEYYRFEIVLEGAPGGDWVLQWASWESLPAGELLPESLEILKELFPERQRMN